MRKRIYILVHKDGTIEPGWYRRKTAQAKQQELRRKGIITELQGMK